jgi:aspartate aminotransferase-like enzyme
MLKRRLFTPGPVEVPPRVLLAMAQPILHHRSAEFEALLDNVLRRLQPILGTTRPVLALAASGTGGMEAVVANLARRGEPALVVCAGRFGQRWGEILTAYGVPAPTLDVDWGQVPTPQALEEALAKHPGVRVVFLTHSETSTGILVDLEALAKVARARSCLVAVDCITSACAHRIRMDAWGLDAVVSGSQKGFMLPPGLAFIALSEAGEARAAGADLPRFYFNLTAMQSAHAKRTTPFTPAVSLVMGLAESLSMLEEEGLEAAIERHAQLGQAARAAVAALGLPIFPAQPSNVVTVFRTPVGVDGDQVRRELERRFGVKIAGGQGRLKGQVLRLGHLGWYDATDLLGALGALERVLLDAGAGVGSNEESRGGAAVAAASQILALRRASSKVLVEPRR